MPKLRAFELVDDDDVTEGMYVTFRTYIEEQKPDAWQSIEDLPADLLYGFIIRAAIKAGWVKDVVEKNEYDEETRWSWTLEYYDGIKAGTVPKKKWGQPILKRWIDYKEIDPN